MKEKNRKITPTQVIILGFFVTILIGALLLKLPISNTKQISTLDAIFTSITSTCVTGLTTVTLSEQFTTFGQVIIMLLVQIGGLGFMVFISLLLIIFGKKITLKERILISQSLNQNSLKGMAKLTKTIFKYTLTFEIIGALLLATFFVPIYGWGEGLFQSIFHAVSAFCNAGVDILPHNSSFIELREVPLVNLVICSLTIIGGLGFFVWSDIENCVIKGIKEKHSIKRICSSFSLHTKIVLIVTFILLLTGTIFIYMLEADNILSDLSTSNKWIASFFQSTQSRTSGMSTVDLGEVHNCTKLIISILMIIGGAPGSTAGGIKIVTFAIILLSILSSIKGKKHLNVYRKEIPTETVNKAFVILGVALIVIITSMIFLVMFEPDIMPIDLLFECVSAYATVGLSTGITSALTLSSKIIIMFLMFIGRVGTITMAVLFIIEKPKNEDSIRYANENVMIG